ncbi:hypothetical protein [Undibacterium hunanense]|uniref:hypothetical protein n=1 Tax=Undibacterium hunanense TaxID=2762292 RepID=UPI00164BC5EC|nr:hypothetical protein [Undibacterium hunanense]
MKRRLGLVFVFLACLSSGYAAATDEPELSPTMQCIVDCMAGGPYTLKGCIIICVP